MVIFNSKLLNYQRVTVPCRSFGWFQEPRCGVRKSLLDHWRVLFRWAMGKLRDLWLVTFSNWGFVTPQKKQLQSIY